MSRPVLNRGPFSVMDGSVVDDDGVSVQFLLADMRHLPDPVRPGRALQALLDADRQGRRMLPGSRQLVEQFLVAQEGLWRQDVRTVAGLWALAGSQVLDEMQVRSPSAEVVQYVGRQQRFWSVGELVAAAASERRDTFVSFGRFVERLSKQAARRRRVLRAAVTSAVVVPLVSAAAALL